MEPASGGAHMRAQTRDLLSGAPPPRSLRSPPEAAPAASPRAVFSLLTIDAFENRSRWLVFFARWCFSEVVFRSGKDFLIANSTIREGVFVTKTRLTPAT